jgi:hypothetical protein
MKQYRQIDPNSVHQYGLVIDGVQMAVDWKNVRVGQIVQIALKEDVRPASTSALRSRIMAPYVQKVIVSTDVCTTCAGDVDNDVQTICPECIESWGWDWFVRFDRKFNTHGETRIYQYYGCRCPECRWIQKITYSYTKTSTNGAVRGCKHSPSTIARSVLNDQAVPNEQ